MKLKALMLVVLSIVLISSFATTTANPGVSLSAIPIDDSAGGTDNTAIYSIHAELEEVGVSEHVKLSIDPSSPSWLYAFSKDEFDLDPINNTKDITFYMQLPQGTPAGNYIIKVNSNATILTPPPWLPPEEAFTQCPVTVNVPVVVTPAQVPALTPAGILALVGLLAVVAVCGIKRER
ncbi:hypothetical protein C5S31_04770 [ANME-1 cluster archaeon GoMg2]|nr:hypothetical protein [ANME-1 cluster archaeon GoMg2]